MKTILNKLKKYILFYIIIYILIFISLYFILNYFNLTYRSWFVLTSIILAMFGLTMGTFQFIHHKKVKIMIVIVLGIILVFSSPYAFFNYYRPENVVIKDNKKYVTYSVETHNSYVSGTRILYYEYGNFMFSGNNIILEEYYENPFLLGHTLIGIKYYDKDGNVIKEYKYNYTTQELELVEDINS